MGTLQELVRYCNDEQRLGALLLTGERGSGKTYLIEHDLANELRDTHFIVRVSLLSVDSLEALNKAIRKRYLMVCTPFLGKWKQERERKANIRTAINDILRSLTPIGGNIASAVGSVDLLEYIPLEPVVEDLHDKGIKKNVVLVFDDLDHSDLDWRKFIGIINEYCENKKFATIVIGDADIFRAPDGINFLNNKMVKEKTISRTVRYTPDYGPIIHSIITDTAWKSPAYAAFLAENEEKIKGVFCQDTPAQDKKLSPYHHIRSLHCALKEFSQLFDILKDLEVEELSEYLYSFIVCVLVSRNGLSKDGKPSFDNSNAEIKQCYPGFRPDLLPEEIWKWIEEGIWDEERIVAFIKSR